MHAYKAPHIPASDVHYFSREDVKSQRALYAEKAMPFLRISETSVLETDRIITKQGEEIEKLKSEIQLLRRKLAVLDDPVLLDALKRLRNHERLQ